MKTHSAILLLVAVMTFACGPEQDDTPKLDPEETFSAFCQTLFACPEVEAMLEYGSQQGCEDVHRDDYEQRDETCKELILIYEDCLAALTCDELVMGCSDEELRLGQKGCRMI